MNEVIKTISNLFIFFYEKDLHTQKAQKAQKEKIAPKRLSSPLDVFYAHKNAAFFYFLFACMRFVLAKSFRKKIMRFEIVLMTSFTLLLILFLDYFNCFATLIILF